MGNNTYCTDCCKIGKAARDEYLSLNNSVYDAVSDFIKFMRECSKTCPYKEVITKDQ